MRIQDIMSREIISIASDATLSSARNLMRVEGVHHLLVEDGRRVVGVLSEGDLGGKKLPSREGTVADVMTRDVTTASPDDTIKQAANRFRGRNIGCLPVVDEGGRPVGIVTTTDLLELIGRGVEKPIRQTVRPTLSRRGPRQTGATARRSRRG